MRSGTQSCPPPPDGEKVSVRLEFLGVTDTVGAHTRWSFASCGFPDLRSVFQQSKRKTSVFPENFPEKRYVLVEKFCRKKDPSVKKNQSRVTWLGRFRGRWNYARGGSRSLQRFRVFVAPYATATRGASEATQAVDQYFAIK